MSPSIYLSIIYLSICMHAYLQSLDWCPPYVSTTTVALCKGYVASPPRFCSRLAATHFNDFWKICRAIFRTQRGKLNTGVVWPCLSNLIRQAENIRISSVLHPSMKTQNMLETSNASDNACGIYIYIFWTPWETSHTLRLQRCKGSGRRKRPASENSSDKSGKAVRMTL